MMVEYNVENVFNIYFVSDFVGNCGYNLFYVGIVNVNGCSSFIDIIWLYEVGYVLSLLYFFFGWEGGVSWDGSVDYNFSDFVLECVIYDYIYFQDMLIFDIFIIDMIFVELVDGSNCIIVVDGFCDMFFDYLVLCWICNGNGVSFVV